MSQSVIPHDTIPEPLKSLLAKHDWNYTAATLACGYKKTSVPQLRRIAMGQANAGPVVIARINAALKGEDPKAAASPVSTAIRQAAKAAKKPETKLHKSPVNPIDGYPALLQRLIKQHGSTIKAAHALGMKSQYWVTKFNGAGAAAFDAEAMARVRAALKGELPVAEPTPKKTKKAKKAKAKGNGAVPDDDMEIDAGSLGFAIVFSTPAALEALYDAGIAMGGEWVYKKRIGKQWLSVCRLDHQELQAFRAIAKVIAIEVATP